MRIFIAIELEDEMRAYLADVQERTRRECKRGNFTPPENFHLTLRFIGEATGQDVELLKEAMEETGFRNRNFPLTLDKIGFFPKGTRGVLWTGVQQNAALLRIFSTLEKNLSKQGFPREKKGLSPHITLGRDVEPFRGFQEVQRKVIVEKKTMLVTKISLMESVRMGPRLIYKPIYSVNLQEEHQK